MRVDIFCESGKSYGLGHLRRCENLLLHLKEIFPTIEFAKRFHSEFTLPSYALEIVIIDSYIAPREFYESISCKILICLDDYHRLPYPSDAFILRPTLGAKTLGKTYGGEGYVILHPTFSLPPKVPMQKGRILITLGGSIQTKLLEEILSTLKGDIHIINPYFTHPQYTTHHSLTPQEICSLIDSAEFVICAGGGGLNEVLSRGKKTITLCIATNQRTQVQNAHLLPSTFTVLSLKNLSSKLTSALHSLSSLPSPAPKSLGYHLRPWLYKLILPLISADNALHFSLLSHAQKLEVLALRNQQEVRENSLHSHIISAQEHLRFISSLSFLQFFWAFFEDERKEGEIIAVGSLSIKEDYKAILGIYKNARYKNIGEKVLHSLFISAKKLNLSTIELEVLKTNSKAIHLYKKTGFHITAENQTSFVMEKNL